MSCCCRSRFALSGVRSSPRRSSQAQAAGPSARNESPGAPRCAGCLKSAQERPSADSEQAADAGVRQRRDRGDVDPIAVGHACFCRFRPVTRLGASCSRFDQVSNECVADQLSHYVAVPPEDQAGCAHPVENCMALPTRQLPAASALHRRPDHDLEVCCLGKAPSLEPPPVLPDASRHRRITSHS